MTRRRVELDVNGERQEVWVEPSERLVEVLHDDFGVGDVRYGCGEGVCGTCTVLLDDDPVSACLVFAVQCEGRRIVTVRGLAGDGLHPLQQAFLEHGASQCGFCTPGMILAAYDLLRRKDAPTRSEVCDALVGNLCRCTGYSKIVEAIEDVATGTFVATGSRPPAGGRTS